MKFLRLSLGLLFGFTLVSCRHPRLGLELNRVTSLGGGVRAEVTAIAVAPVFRGAEWASSSRERIGLALIDSRAAFRIADLAPLGTSGVAYPALPLEWREIRLPTEAVARVVDAMLADPRFAGHQRTPNTLLSVRVVRLERGRALVSEVFVEVGAARDFAAVLTNAAIGTDALRSVLQWEMNL